MLLVDKKDKGVAIAWACLLVGIAIYMLFRSRQHLGFMVVDAVGLGNVVDELRQSVAFIHLPDFVRYCLPDGLWTTSYILFADHANRHSTLRSRIAWTSVIPIIGIASELMQASHILPGHFDPLDLVSYSLPLIMYYCIQIKRYKI